MINRFCASWEYRKGAYDPLFAMSVGNEIIDAARNDHPQLRRVNYKNPSVGLRSYQLDLSIDAERESRSPVRPRTSPSRLAATTLLWNLMVTRNGGTIGKTLAQVHLLEPGCSLPRHQDIYEEDVVITHLLSTADFHTARDDMRTKDIRQDFTYSMVPGDEIVLRNGKVYEERPHHYSTNTGDTLRVSMAVIMVN